MAGGAIVIPVITPTRNGIAIAIAQYGTPEEDKALEMPAMVLEDSNTCLYPITTTTVDNSSTPRLCLNAFKTVCLSIRKKMTIPRMVIPKA